MQQEFELKLVHFIQIHKSSIYKSLYITQILYVELLTESKPYDEGFVLGLIVGCLESVVEGVA